MLIITRYNLMILVCLFAFFTSGCALQKIHIGRSLDPEEKNLIKSEQKMQKIPLNMAVNAINSSAEKTFKIINVDPFGSFTVIFDDKVNETLQVVFSSIFKEVTLLSENNQYSSPNGKIYVSLNPEQSKGYIVAEAPIQIPAKELWVEITLNVEIANTADKVIWSKMVTGKYSHWHKPEVLLLTEENGTYAIKRANPDNKDSWWKHFDPILATVLSNVGLGIVPGAVAATTMKKASSDTEKAVRVAMSNSLIQVLYEILKDKDAIIKALQVEGRLDRITEKPSRVIETFEGQTYAFGKTR